MSAPPYLQRMMELGLIMGINYKLFIAGEWVNGSSGAAFPAMNPFTSKPWASVSEATESDVASAVAAARHAFETNWRMTSGRERARLLLKLAELLEKNGDRMATLESTDNGKVIRETRNQMSFSARQYEFFAGYADKLWGSVIPVDQKDVFDYAALEPIGVAALITAWNSPMGLLSNKLAPALAAGNTVVIKPSEHASATTAELCRLAEEAGFPPGVINLVMGDAKVGKALVGGGGVDCVSFTGSPAAGRHIARSAGENLIPVTLELGGKSPNIVFADADLNKAVVGAVAGIFAATGQTCIAGSRLLVQRPIYGEMIERLTARAERIVLGDPLDRKTEMGTTANEPQLQKILDFIRIAKEEGARLVAGGQRPTEKALKAGLFVRPTIFADVENRMTIAQEEVFGPVLSIIPFDTEDEAVAIAKDTRYGLAAGIWTQNISRAFRMAREMRAGTVWVNTYRVSACQAPFGGVKESGFGRERGQQALAAFTTCKNVMIDFSAEERDPFSVRT
jgi:aldehyde dehydrogenase (NAD+)